ncbi:MAG: LysR family transcriptional regulator [Sporomusaceae bacterium]|nr:LysR family transcriptional regulator [Sporomusaceae bacterium]
MDSKDWEIIKILSEEKNITNASKRLYISQPAITYRLKTLEKEFNTKLFIRTAKGILFTHQGEQLLKYANKMIYETAKITEHILNSSDGVHGLLRLGVSSTFAHYVLPKFLKNFTKYYPDVGISLKTGLSYQVVKMLQQEEISIAIIRGEHLWREKHFLLSEEPISLVSLLPVALEELPYHPRIDFNTDYTLRNLVEDWWHEKFHFPPMSNISVDNISTCRQLVLHNLGWAIFPAIGLKENDNLFRQNLFFKNGKPLTRPTWLLCRNAALDLAVVRTFVEYAQQFEKRA